MFGTLLMKVNKEDLMEVHGFGKSFDYYSQEDVDNWDYGKKESLTDIYYYEALNLLGCKRKDILTILEVDFKSIDEFDRFNEDINKVYCKSRVRLPSECRFMSAGILSKVVIVELNNKEFTILQVGDMRHAWYYFTREFIKEYSKITGTKIKYGFLLPWTWD